MKQKKKTGKLSRRKRIFIGAAVMGGIAAGVYFGTAVYFSFHFLPGTMINGRDFSLKTAEKFQREVEKIVDDYTLTVTGTKEVRQRRTYDVSSDGTKENEHDGNCCVIKGRDIELKLVTDDQAQRVMDGQNCLMWPFSFFKKEVEEVPFSVTYDEKLLEEKIRTLDIIVSGAEGAVSARPVFDGKAFVISPEVYGVLPEAAEKKIRQCIEELKTELDLGEAGLLEIPAFLSDSPEVENACEIMNQYCKTQVVYTMDQEITVDAQVISGWLTCDENMNVTLNEDAVREWVSDLAGQYDTVGKVRIITTPSGKTAEVCGGTYGWVIDTAAETAALTENIRNGETVSREPVYTQRAADRSAQDWGTTYLEVDLTAQYMWYIEGGEVCLETDVVTGEPVTGMETPQGVYSILYTQRDAILTGEIDPKTGAPLYRTGVRYWMPFTQQGHGFHDADWQTAFGGNVYTYSGSHGCVNMPVDKAGELYSMLETGTPVVIHY